MPDTPLNPDALEVAKRTFALTNPSRLCAYEDLPEKRQQQIHSQISQTIETYLAVAQPEVNSVPGVYDLGSPEPAGVDHVVECDEFGEPDERGDSANDPTWSKTTDGTRWKGYKDGKEYRSWADLVRRYGPLTEYRPEVKP